MLSQKAKQASGAMVTVQTMYFVTLNPRGENVPIESHGSQAIQRQTSQGKDVLQSLFLGERKGMCPYLSKQMGKAALWITEIGGGFCKWLQSSFPQKYSCLKGCYYNNSNNNNNSSMFYTVLCFQYCTKCRRLIFLELVRRTSSAQDRLIISWLF